MDAVVVGSGPNGLTAAIVLAKAGYEVVVLEAKDTIGGGTRTEELTLPGFHHDVCSAFHPLGAASPAFASMPLSDHGLEWIVPEIQVAHPLDDGTAGVLYHSLSDSIAALGKDGPKWQGLVGRVAEGWDTLGPLITRPLLRVPRKPFEMAKVARGVLPASLVAKRFSGPRAKALFAGIAAHGSLPLSAPMTASTAIVLGALAHVGGWPVARGGSSAISRALLSYLTSLGGSVVTNHLVRSVGDLPSSRAVLFDTPPATLTRVYGDKIPRSTQRWIRHYSHGVGSYKVDFALSGPVPWTANECHTAGTVHLGGTFAEVAAAESSVGVGVNPDRPFVLVGQQSLFDPSRAPDGQHTLWAYTHVPNGFRGSVIGQIESQVERFAPGFHDLILAKNVMGTRDVEDHNPNYLGGDIAAGAMTLRQTIARPRFSSNPYRTAIPGVYLCSASTPPGPGVHGIPGLHAAHAAIAGHLS